MREIKFRAWYPGDSRQKPFMEYDFLVSSYDGHIEDGAPDERIIYGTDMVLMQYTGLKDKNGKEIYEGDVLEACIQTTRDGRPNGSYTKRKSVKWVVYPNKIGWNVGLSSRYEVIGNIYENPELLEGKQ